MIIGLMWVCGCAGGCWTGPMMWASCCLVWPIGHRLPPVEWTRMTLNPQPAACEYNFSIQAAMLNLPQQSLTVMDLQWAPQAFLPEHRVLTARIGSPDALFPCDIHGRGSLVYLINHHLSFKRVRWDHGANRESFAVLSAWCLACPYWAGSEHHCGKSPLSERECENFFPGPLCDKLLPPGVEYT